jgi:transcriptional regulator with XRE-family HTH domain
MTKPVPAASIKAFRKARGWSQTELASLLGVDQATVSRMEHGTPAAGPVKLLLALLMNEQAQANEGERIAPSPTVPARLHGPPSLTGWRKYFAALAKDISRRLERREMVVVEPVRSDHR